MVLNLHRQEEQTACTQAFARHMKNFRRPLWSDVEVWNAMDAYRRAMEEENHEWARRMTDRQRAGYD